MHSILNDIDAYDGLEAQDIQSQSVQLSSCSPIVDSPDLPILLQKLLEHTRDPNLPIRNGERAMLTLRPYAIAPTAPSCMQPTALRALQNILFRDEEARKAFLRYGMMEDIVSLAKVSDMPPDGSSDDSLEPSKKDHADDRDAAICGIAMHILCTIYSHEEEDYTSGFEEEIAEEMCWVSPLLALLSEF